MTAIHDRIDRSGDTLLPPFSAEDLEAIEILLGDPARDALLEQITEGICLEVE